MAKTGLTRYITLSQSEAAQFIHQGSVLESGHILFVSNQSNSEPEVFFGIGLPLAQTPGFSRATFVKVAGLLDGSLLPGHIHAIADVFNLQVALDSKAALLHTHEIANVNGLQGELDGLESGYTAGLDALQSEVDTKADAGHTHTALALNSLVLNAAPTGAGVQSNKSDISSNSKLVRVDGAQAASLSEYGAYHNGSSPVNIDNLTPGQAGLFSATNDGTFPTNPGTSFWFIMTQRMYTNSAAIQFAYPYYSSTPTDVPRMHIRIKSGSGAWGDWHSTMMQTDSGATVIDEGIIT
jgi:hypothetical protein